MSSTSSTLHIVGAGLAGLAAALSAPEGMRVAMYEAAPQAGGRCRSYYDRKLKTTLDNGNHLVLGANPAVLDYLRRIGAEAGCITSDAPRYSFIDLATRQPFHFSPPRFKGIPAREWLHLLKLLRPAQQRVVAECIPRQTALYRKLIEPFTLAALNTRPEQASAPLLAALFRRMLMSGRAGWRYYAPAHSLSATFIDPALTRIKGRGGSIRYQTSIQRLESAEGRITALHTAKERIALDAGDAVILAVAPAALRELLPEAAPDFSWSPILNAHFLWPQAGMFRGMMPFMGVINGAVQWIFFHEGRISTTTSAADALVDQDEDSLAHLLWQDVTRALFMEGTKLPPCRIIKEKRATYAATPENLARRPGATTAYGNLFLAGDYLDSSLPATLEAAVISGYQAASLAAARNND